MCRYWITYFTTQGYKAYISVKLYISGVSNSWCMNRTITKKIFLDNSANLIDEGQNYKQIVQYINKKIPFYFTTTNLLHYTVKSTGVFINQLISIIYVKTYLIGHNSQVKRILLIGGCLNLEFLISYRAWSIWAFVYYINLHLN